VAIWVLTSTMQVSDIAPHECKHCPKFAISPGDDDTGPGMELDIVYFRIDGNDVLKRAREGCHFYQLAISFVAQEKVLPHWTLVITFYSEMDNKLNVYRVQFVWRDGDMHPVDGPVSNFGVFARPGQ
jgi:hypothetical protein